jgi:uncharacterized SAM-binding protein YcdF (DUF218 family)
MSIEVQSWDTDDQARVLEAAVFWAKPFALVTSAYHMPRALLAVPFPEGLNPIPAPADFRARDFDWSHDLFIPRAGALAACETAIHEYLGLLYTWVKTW